MFQHTAARRRLPLLLGGRSHIRRGFNTQPPEGGCTPDSDFDKVFGVSTHSRPKAAAPPSPFQLGSVMVSTHSRPKAAALINNGSSQRHKVSTHSRPKAAALLLGGRAHVRRGFNTQPPEGGCQLLMAKMQMHITFQHTAARRRLLPT